jgi:hypothetical protein
LQYYGLEQHGNAIERRRHLAKNLGVKLVHPFWAQEDRLEALDGCQRRADTRLRNSSALDGADFVVAFSKGDGDHAPQSLPGSLQDLFEMLMI